MLKRLEFSEAAIQAALDRTALVMAHTFPKSGGAVFGYASKGESKILMLHPIGEPQNWAQDFNDLTTRKLRLALQSDISTRGSLRNPARLCPEDRNLHPGGYPYGDHAVACSGLGDGNEPIANLLALNLGLL